MATGKQKVPRQSGFTASGANPVTADQSAKPLAIPAEPVAAAPLVLAPPAAKPIPEKLAAPVPVPAEPVIADLVVPVPVIAAPAPVEIAPAPAPVSVPTVSSAKEVIMDATTQTKTIFAEATERAKTGFAKSQAMFGEMGEFNKGNLEALVESSKIAAKGFEALGQNAAAYVRGQFEDAQAQARSLASVSSPTEFLKLQGDFARSSFEKMIAQTSTNTEAMLKLVGEVAQPISNRVALAADKIKVAA